MIHTILYYTILYYIVLYYAIKLYVGRTLEASTYPSNKWFSKEKTASLVKPLFFSVFPRTMELQKHRNAITRNAYTYLHTCMYLSI